MTEREIEYAAPSIYYGDPADAVDLIREANAKAKRKAERDRKYKSMRIQASVRKVMRDGGDKHGKR